MRDAAHSAGRGRPLRALGLVLGGWIAMRVAWLWPHASTPPRPASIPPAAPAPATQPAPPLRLALGIPGDVPAVPTRPLRERTFAPTPVVPPPPTTLSPAPAIALPRPPMEHVLALLGLVRYGTPDPALPGPSRWSGSAWAIVRGAGGAGGVATPQLGGSQAGARLAYALDDRLALAARVAGALGTRQREAAIGVEWRPTALPLRVVAEQRIGLAATRGGPALGMVGGVSDRPLPLGLALDGYAQAGVIARDSGEGYADGAIRVGRAVGALDLSLGAWGAAQRGAARLDLGPSVAVVVPVAAARVRVSLDWRQRVAGNARPASGVALSLGTDF